ncbi:flagellar hook-associated protein FlgL [Oceanobacillus alkalisoli]|uniref:flagellar hook-associated protein FlgL n=1 Tax=Oceanobacillus alkalisoli TaxID=2925113 RepID=UPI001EF10AFA|nr:flagellar hook-associated protein FlgL [Oceanobacillus alkalisoli]MCF3943442.1 flagellar hook-associated protein FlgL [Oceanobacillus alkalisoli]MCG5104031.1 flagellar hook-associated protein FlgL [Oceanobacillus alkalisoli]
MRVTQSMISNNLLTNLNKSYAEVDKYFNQLNTGKKFSRPSEDPVAAMKGIGYRTELHRIEQYQRNTGEVQNWYDNTDAALDQTNSGLQRLRYLAVQASNGTYGEAELKNIAEEAEQIKLDLIDVANTKVNDKYIFNGTRTNEAPVEMVDGEVISDFNESSVEIEVAAGVTLAANVDGNKAFTDGETDMFAVIDSFITSLNTGNADGEIDQSIAAIDGIIDNVINARADLGARVNRLDLVENRLEQQEIIATGSLSANEDVNYAEAITNLMTQESIHRAALSSGSRMIQPSLLDFLR